MHMEYDAIVESLPKNQIVNVEMRDGTILKCRKVPLNTLESVSAISSGLQKTLNSVSSSMNFIATCGKNKLYYAVGDPSTYMKSGQGNVLSSSVGRDGKITGQPGFRQADFSKAGLKVATNTAKIVPVLAVAITIVEVGTKIWLNQHEIKQRQIDYFNKHAEINEDSIHNLWQALNDYPLSRCDEAHRTANLVIIKKALCDGENSFRKLSNQIQPGKPISEQHIYALKTALDVCSLAYLLNVMYTRAENCAEYVDMALKDIDGKTKTFSSACEERQKTLLKNCERHTKRLAQLQFDNDNLNKKSLAKRAGIDVLSGGLAELGSFAVKKMERKLKQQDEMALARLKECRDNGNPYAKCIMNAQGVLLNKTPLLRDNEYMYYPLDEK